MIKHVTTLLAVICAALALVPNYANAAPPIWIKFAPGSYGAIVNGHVTLRAPQQVYKVNVAAGQTMIITFTGAGTMRGSVQCQGAGDGPYYGSGNSFTVPASGECDISVGANTMAAPWTGGFTLAVLVTAP